MADNTKLTAEIDINTKKFEKGLSSVESATKDIEKVMSDALGGMDVVLGGLGDTAKSSGNDISKAFSGSVSSVSKVEDKVEELKDTIKEVGKVDVGSGTFDGLTDSLKDSEGDVKRFESALKGIDTSGVQGVATEVDGIGTSVKGAEGDVARFDSALGAVSGSRVKRVSGDFDETGSSAKGAGGDVDKFSSSVKGAGSGSSLPDVEKDLDSIADKAGEASGMLETMAGTLSGMAGLGSMSEMFDSTMSGAEASYGVKFHLENALGREATKKEMEEIMKGYAEVSATVGDEGALEVYRTAMLKTDLEGGGADVSDLVELSKGATRMSINYGGDADAFLEQSAKVSEALKINQKDSMAFINSALRNGFPEGEIDTIAEYGQTLMGNGMALKQYQNMVLAVGQSGTWNVDSMLDGFKEGGIRVAEFGGTLENMTDDQIALYDASGIGASNVADWSKAMIKGGAEGEKAWNSYLSAVVGIEDPTLKHMAMQDLIGTMYEDNADGMDDVMKAWLGGDYSASDEVKRFREETDRLDAEPWYRIKTAMSEIARIASGVLAPVLEIVAGVLEKISENPALVTGLTYLAIGVSVLATALGTVMSVQGGIKMLEFLFGGSKILAGAQGASILPALGLLAGKLLLVVAAIVALGGIIYVISQFWTEISFLNKEISILMQLGLIKLLQGLATMIEGYGQGLGMMIRGLGEILLIIPNVLSTIFLGILSGLETLTLGIFDYITGFITNVATFLLDTITSVLGFFGIDISAKTGEMKAGLTTTFEGMRTDVTSIFGAMTGFVEEKTGSANETVRGIFGGLSESVTGIFDGMAGGIRTSTGTWKDHLHKAHVDNLEETYGFSSRYMNSGRGITTNLANGMTSEEGKVTGAMSDAMLNANGEIEADKSTFYTQGQNIAGNVGSGITANEGGIIGAMRGALSKVSAMLPFSPPKDKTSPLANIHKNGIGEQIAKGIYAGQGKVDNAMNSLLSFGSQGISMESFDMEVGRYREQLGAMVSGNINASIGENNLLNVEVGQQSANINLNLGGRDYKTFVEDIFNEEDKRARLRNM